MALFAGKHQTPWSVETPGDGEAWLGCYEGRPVAGEVYTDMAAATDAAGEFYRPHPLKVESSPDHPKFLSIEL